MPLPPDPLEALLLLVRHDQPGAAAACLAAWPHLPDTSVHAAAAAGNPAALSAALARDPGLAFAPAADWAPLLYACRSRLPEATSGGRRRCAELLLEAGADPNTFVREQGGQDGARLAALYFACDSGHADVARALLERGANPDDGESAYHAAEKNHRDCLEALAEHGADLGGLQQPWGNTPLYFVAGYRDYDRGVEAATLGMHWLLEHGADPNLPSAPLGETPLHRVAAFRRSPEHTLKLLSHGAKPRVARADGRTPYALAVRAGHDEVARLLASKGGDAPLRESDRLVGACMRGDLAAAREQLAARPGLFAEFDDEDRSAMAFAAFADRTEGVLAMADAGFDLAWEGLWGGTALHHAAWRGNLDLARQLLARGADVHIRDRQYGSSPLAWAAHGSTHCRSADAEYVAMVEMLAAAGALPEEAVNRWNEPAASLASPAVSARLVELGFANGGRA